MFRVPLAALLYVLASSWALRHLGWSWGSKLPMIGLAMGAASGLYKFLGESSAGGWPDRARRAGYFVLSPAVLGALVFAVAIPATFVSSVLVVGNDVYPGTKMELAQVGAQNVRRKSVAQGQNAARFLTWTTPFGRTLALKVDGYNAYVFDLFPWRGQVVSTERDLTWAPSVFIRLPSSQLELCAGGHFAIILDDTIKVPTDSMHASVVLGRQTLPQLDLINSWRSELTGSGLSDRKREFAIQRWQRPVFEQSLRYIQPGQKIEAEFVSRGGVVIAHVQHIVGSEPIQDVSLLGVGF